MIELLLACTLLFALSALPIILPAWKENRRRAFIMLAALVAVSGGMYAVAGSPRVVPLAAQYQEEVAALRKTADITRALLASHPDNLEAWLTLGQALMDLGEYPRAADAFRRAALLSRGHPRIIMGYAEAQIAAADGKVTDDAMTSVEMALKLDPKLPMARYYHAVRLLQQGKQPEAMKKMKEFYRELPDDDPVKKLMKSQIGR